MAFTDTALKAPKPKGKLYIVSDERELYLKNAHMNRDEAASAAAMGESPAQQKQLAKVAAADSTTVGEMVSVFRPQPIGR
jgi:hypothetical protein